MVGWYEFFFLERKGHPDKRIYDHEEGSGPRCVQKYVNYIEPPRADPSVPIDQLLPGGVRYSVNESDSGRTNTLNTRGCHRDHPQDNPGARLPADHAGKGIRPGIDERRPDLRAGRT
jgi:hypothetical protein